MSLLGGEPLALCNNLKCSMNKTGTVMVLSSRLIEIQSGHYEHSGVEEVW